MKEEIKNKPTSLYRAYAEGGELLYVGISLSVMARLSSHSSSSEWFKHAAFVDVARFPSRQEAIDAETKAIKEEYPFYNKQGAVKRPVVYSKRPQLQGTSLDNLLDMHQLFNDLLDPLERTIEEHKQRIREAEIRKGRVYKIINDAAKSRNLAELYPENVDDILWASCVPQDSNNTEELLKYKKQKYQEKYKKKRAVHETKKIH